MDKVFTSHRMQIRILRNRGLKIKKGSQASRAMRILERENYYNLINGYKDLFLVPNAPLETYKQNADFFEIYALYEFDRELRSIFFKRILKIENNMRSAIAYEFSRVYGHDNYLKLSNFDQRDLKEVSKLIATIQMDISRNYPKNSSIKHYMNTYGYIPLWVLVNILTLGTISKFYSLMKNSECIAVSRRFGLTPPEIKSFLAALTLFRNACAHDERFYNFKSKEMIPDTNTHRLLNLPRGNNGYIVGKKDIFALLICIKTLLKRKEFTEIYIEIVKEVNKLSGELTTITIDDVLRGMGFPQNWTNIKNV